MTAVRRPSRRGFIETTAALAAVGLAGCLGSDDGDGDDPPAEPIALTDGQSCDGCGMTIGDQFGPAGQLFYADGEPDDRDGPLRFDSVAELVATRDERERRGRTLRAAFVTDYSSVEYAIDDRDGTDRISTHADESAFADATALHYVAASDVDGAMGSDFLPFSDRSDAEAFVDEHGGAVRDWDRLGE